MSTPSSNVSNPTTVRSSEGSSQNVQGSEDDARRGNRFRKGQNNGTAPGRLLKFEGRCEALKGSVYDCSESKNIDQFSTTSKEIAEYIGREYKFGMDTRLSLERLEPIELIAPKDPSSEASRTELRIWEKRVDEFVKREVTLRENLKTAYSLIWGQCSSMMRQKLESHEEFETIANDGDAIALLKLIKDATYHFECQRKIHHVLWETKRLFFNSHQGRHMPLLTYYKRFQNMYEVIKHIGGSVGTDEAIYNDIANAHNIEVHQLTPSQKEEGTQQFLAIGFILGADKARFGRLQEKLNNDYLQGMDVYPKS